MPLVIFKQSGVLNINC